MGEVGRGAPRRDRRIEASFEGAKAFEVGIDLGMLLGADATAQLGDVARDEIENRRFLRALLGEDIGIANLGAEQSIEGRLGIRFGMKRLAVGLVDHPVNAVRFAALHAQLEGAVQRFLGRIIGLAQVRRAIARRSRHHLIDRRATSPAGAMPVATVEVRSRLRIVQDRPRP